MFRRCANTICAYLASLEQIGLSELIEIKEAALARWNEAIQ